MSSTAVSFERDFTSASVIEVASVGRKPLSIYSKTRDNGIKTSNEFFHNQDTDIGILNNNERREGQANEKHGQRNDKGVDIGILSNNERALRGNSNGALRHNDPSKHTFRTLKKGKGNGTKKTSKKNAKGRKCEKKSTKKSTTNDQKCPTKSKALPATANMEEIVGNCLILEDCPYGSTIGCWDTSLVVNMDRAFYYSTPMFNDPIDGWDTSSCTSMKYMFELAEGFNQDIGSWDVSEVTVMQRMFYQPQGFNQDIGDWDVSKVTNMQGMFRGAYAFNQCLSPWAKKLDPPVSTDYMFTNSGCEYSTDPSSPFIDPNDWCRCKISV
jgi:surface protein